MQNTNMDIAEALSFIKASIKGIKWGENQNKDEQNQLVEAISVLLCSYDNLLSTVRDTTSLLGANSLVSKDVIQQALYSINENSIDISHSNEVVKSYSYRLC